MISVLIPSNQRIFQLNRYYIQNFRLPANSDRITAELVPRKFKAGKSRKRMGIM